MSVLQLALAQILFFLNKGARMESEQLQEYKSLVNEVTKGMEQVKQLKASSSTNQETVLERMLSSYGEALSILNGSASEEQCEPVVSSASDAPASSVSSVWEVTQAGEQSSGQPKPKYRRQSTFTEQVSVTQSELADDGYLWRKYGQKPMLNSKYPRSFYRCTHRHDRGCLATKQVQMSDDNPTVYVVTYRGKHTCSRIEPVAPQVFTEQASVTLSESADDGYIWRKYGQKVILNSKYPRSYYRCAYSHDRGCSATKQVQMSDDNPSVYVITYKGKHTCSRIQPVVPQVAVRPNQSQFGVVDDPLDFIEMYED